MARLTWSTALALLPRLAPKPSWRPCRLVQISLRLASLVLLSTLCIWLQRKWLWSPRMMMSSVPVSSAGASFQWGLTQGTKGFHLNERRPSWVFGGNENKGSWEETFLAYWLLHHSLCGEGDMIRKPVMMRLKKNKIKKRRKKKKNRSLMTLSWFSWQREGQ